MQDVPQSADPRALLAEIEREYPKGSERVTVGFAQALLSEVEKRTRTISGTPPSVGIRIRELSQKAKHGMKARDFHAGLEGILTRLGHEASGPAPDLAINRLEGQLRDLRSMVTSPGDIDRKFRDLQEQVAALREGIDGSHSNMADKQEDMLQKFLDSDKRAFIIMPFAREFDNVWFGAIKTACLDCHYAPLRVDEVNLSSLITDDIERYSNMAGVVVVDLTGNNPNVMFELGWSLAKNKKPIVICQGDHASKMAFDVRGIRHISYENTWLGIEELKKKLKDFILATEKSIPSGKTKKGKGAKDAKRAANSGDSSGGRVRSGGAVKA